MLLTVGCGGPQKGLLVGDEAEWQGNVQVEAYLFDARLRRDNKPTSVRLEFFHTDSVIAVAGRGYFGKGALKGRLTPDSLEIYFPTTDEYVREATSDLMASFDCAGNIKSFDIMALFTDLPERVLKGSGTYIAADTTDNQHPVYKITTPGCPWEIELTYARQRKGWRIKSFSFSDGGDVTLKGDRREYKRDATVKAVKFFVPIRESSIRIIP
ncbi:MAG: hypothetical protein AB1483_07430 [Candidatus Zixiibacteriota bacterium]